VRRWPAPQRGSDGGVGWGRFSRRVASVFKVDEKRMCFTWTDDEGDRVVVAAGDPSVARLEWEEAHRAVAERGLKALTLTVHATRADALTAAPRAAPGPAAAEKPAETAEGPLRLGPRPGKLVALDLGVPLREARELVRRANHGDAIARRVVAPSAARWARMARDGSSAVLLRDDLFRAAHAARLQGEVADPKARAAAAAAARAGPAPAVAAARPPPPPPPPAAAAPDLEELRAFGHAVAPEVKHWGVACDVSNMCPIVGTRWHLVGEDYDLCDAEYGKLPDDRKRRFVAIRDPAEAADIVAAAHADARVRAPAPPPPPPAYDAAAADPAALAAAADAALREAIARSLEDVTADVSLEAKAPLEAPAAADPRVLESFPSLASPDDPLFESDDENELVLVSTAPRTLPADAADDGDELALKQALAASLEDK